MGRIAPHRSHLRMTGESGNRAFKSSLHFALNCNPYVQEVLIGSDLRVIAPP